MPSPRSEAEPSLPSALRRLRRAVPGPLDDATWQLSTDMAPLPPLSQCLEAILLVVEEPVADVVLAQITERPRDEVVQTLRELAAEYTEQQRGFDLRQVAGGWRFYTRRGLRARGGEVRPRRPAGQAHPGGAGDPRGGRLPPAGQPLARLRGARRELRRRHAHPATSAAWSRRPAPKSRQVRSCTGRRTTSWNGWACAASTSCRSWPRSCRRRTRSRRSPRRAPSFDPDAPDEHIDHVNTET